MTLYRKHYLLALLNVSVIMLLFSIFSDNKQNPKHNLFLSHHHQEEYKPRNISKQIETKLKSPWKGNPHCSFRVPSLKRKVPFTCGRGNFVSVVKSVCKVKEETEIIDVFLTIKPFLNVVDSAWQPVVLLRSPALLHGQARLPRIPGPGPDQGHRDGLQEGEVVHWSVQLLRLWMYARSPALGQTSATTQVSDQL